MVKKYVGRGSNHFWRIGMFILIFGVFVAIVSAVINHFLNPVDNSYVRELLNYPTQALVIYFVFVMVASVIVPLPTLPFDLIMFDLFDPVSVITIRVFGGLAGGSIGYYLAYNYGRPLLKRWLSKKNYALMEELSNHLSWRDFFIITMIPAINAELMAYVGGVGKIGYRKTSFTLFLAIAYRVLFVAFVRAIR